MWREYDHIAKKVVSLDITSFSLIISMTIAAIDSLQTKNARVVLCILKTPSPRPDSMLSCSLELPVHFSWTPKAVLLASNVTKLSMGMFFNFFL